MRCGGLYICEISTESNSRFYIVMFNILFLALPSFTYCGQMHPLKPRQRGRNVTSVGFRNLKEVRATANGWRNHDRASRLSYPRPRANSTFLKRGANASWNSLMSRRRKKMPYEGSMVITSGTAESLENVLTTDVLRSGLLRFQLFHGLNNKCIDILSYVI